MVSIFDHNDYRQYLRAWIKELGSRSHGIRAQLAKAVGVSPSLVSQILKGDKTFTPNQTSDLCDFLSLSSLESDYFHLLVEADRAGPSRYRTKLVSKIKFLQEQAQSIANRVPEHQKLNSERSAIYYSNWLYSAIGLAVEIPGHQQVDSLSERFQLEPENVKKVLRFLIEAGLLQEETGQIYKGNVRVHVDKKSPFVTQHHKNWRLQGFQKMEDLRVRDQNDEIFFTGPVALSHKDAEKISKMITEFIQSVMKIVKDSPSETLACLNIDWFKK